MGGWTSDGLFFIGLGVAFVGSWLKAFFGFGFEIYMTLNLMGIKLAIVGIWLRTKEAQ